MIGMVLPSPGHQDVHVQKEFHGKSASISRTTSVVSGGTPAGDEKIIAPVSRQRTRRTRPGPVSRAKVFWRMRSESVRLLPGHGANAPGFVRIHFEGDRWHGNTVLLRAVRASRLFAPSPGDRAALGLIVGRWNQIHSPVRQAQGPESVEGLALAATKRALFPGS